jgi:hypothetical protein
MAAPSYVFTIPSSGYSNGFAAGTLASLARVAKLLGEPEELLQDIAMDMEPEDGCLSVLGLGDVSTVAFTSQGVENLKAKTERHR